ncbi:MAG: toxin-antitoxin system antitoxin subunit [Actinobacteria bacterium]|nr:toxin-antitoxin system antitoxin subunit [Actinomycetota bacterium]
MTTKITVSLPDELVAEANAAVETGRASSVSAYVADAMSEQREQDTLTQLIGDMIAEDGPPSPQDYEWAEAVLGRAASGSTRRRSE